MNNLIFEDTYPQIREAIYKRRNKWQYKIPWMDFDDVASIIITHLRKKWHLYDSTKPLLNWVNRIASRQIINIARNNYNSYLPPCASCVCNTGDGACSIYKEQGIACPLYKKWINRGKKDCYNINLPVSSENHNAELKNLPENHIDFDISIERLAITAKDFLTPLEYRVFIMVFINNINEEEVIKILGYKAVINAKGVHHNKQLENIKDSVYKKVRNHVYDN